jgi:WD40 repeat protein
MVQVRQLITGICFIAIAASAALADDISPRSRTLRGHTNSVLSVKFTRDGKTLVSSSRDDTIKVWDVATGELKRTLTNHKGGVYCVVFSHDGKLMASGSIDTKIILWDASTFEPLRTLIGHTGPVRDLAFAPDDKTLASVAEEGTFRLWDVATGGLKLTRTEHAGKKVKAVVYSRDGETIVTAAHDRTLRLWTAAGEPKQVLEGHKSGLEACDISPDGKSIFSASDNGQICLWDCESGKLLRDIPKAHELEIDSVIFSPDGRWVVSGSKDKTEKFWDPRTLEVRHTIRGNPGRSESMCFSPDGKTFVTGFGGTDYSIRLSDISALKE